MLKEITSQKKRKKLFVDVSEIVKSDARTGIQRVVRSIVSELFVNPPNDYEIVLTYTSDQWKGYKIASEYMRSFSNDSGPAVKDSFIRVNQGDVFLGLDLYFGVVAQQAFYSRLSQRGVRVYFLLHDLLPIFMPQKFAPVVQELFHPWLNFISRMDGVICVSRTVADEYLGWLGSRHPVRPSHPLSIGWSHNGADLENSIPTKGLPDNFDAILQKIKARPTFLTVGTIEPRKGVMQIYQAFEQLWKLGQDVNFVLVGKQGWDVESLVKLLREAEKIRNFVWLENISDECLDLVYAHASCLIAASSGEGFGLPLIEAAKHKIPIIAKSLPVFKEVAGAHAYYFSGSTPEALASCILDWLKLDHPPQSDKIPWLSWRQSTDNLKKIIFEDKWYKTWSPQNLLSNKINDRLSYAVKDKKIDGSVEYANLFEGVMKKIGIVVVVNNTHPVGLFHSVEHANHHIKWYLYHDEKDALQVDITDMLNSDQTTFHSGQSNGRSISAWNAGIHASFLDDNDITLVIDEDIQFTPNSFLRYVDFISGVDPLQIAFLVGDKLENGKRIVKSIDFSCFSISRAVIEELGYFDENFTSPYFAGIDYSTRIQKSKLVSTSTMDEGIGARLEHQILPVNVKLQEKIRNADKRDKAYYYKKWGLGLVESDKFFQTPFNFPDYAAHIAWDSRKDIYGGINRWIPPKAKLFFGGEFHSQVGVKESGVGGLHYVRSTNKAGFLAYGPYVPIKHGLYEISVYGMWTNVSDLAWVDIAYDQGKKLVFKVKLNEIEVLKNRVARFQFRLDEDCENLEVRFFVDQQMHMLLALVELVEIKPKRTKVIKVEKIESQAKVNE